MKQSKKVRITFAKGALALAAIAGPMTLMTADPAFAALTGVTGNTIKDTIVNYTTSRTTTNGNGLFLNKTDGPRIELRWRKCNGSSSGPWVNFPDADPTGNIGIGTPGNASTFCLSSIGRGGNTNDTFTANLTY